METKKKINYVRNTIAYTLLATILLCTVVFSMINYIYRDAEANAFDNLHIQTKEIKADINLQMISDRENLLTMANLASRLYSNGESLDLLLNSFEPIGLIENVGILLPDNTFMTRVGKIDVAGELSFYEEAQRGTYISGRVRDITNPEKEVVRSAVPVVSGSETVAILYGVIELDTLAGRYKPLAESFGAQLFVLERGNGNFIIDTWNKELGNLTALGTREYIRNFSYEAMRKDILAGDNGYTAFLSAITGDYLYAHYAPLEIGDWHIMLSEPESNVFAKARTTMGNLLIMFSVVVLIMVAYLILIYTTERRQSKMNLCASQTRKLLLEINQQYESIKEALINITRFAKSRSAFFVDTDGEDYNYTIPSMEGKLLSEEARNYFIFELLSYAGKHRSDRSVTVLVFNITANARFKRSTPKLYAFMKTHDIKRISFAAVSDHKKLISILGVVNPKRRVGVALLKDIAVCFSMAIYNKKYLNQTESIAVTDSLTGLSNRMAYNRDIIQFEKEASDLFACAYIDVNELHVVNNKYGHAAGDAMLMFIANALKEVFAGNSIYRMGGDEFLVFTENLTKEDLLSAIDQVNKKVEAMNYHISIGMDFRDKNTDIESLVKEAEKRMYAAKAEYYQRKGQKNIAEIGDRSIEHISTGIREIDATFMIMSLHYYGIYCVSLKTDRFHRVLMPAYFKQLSEKDDRFSKVFSRYIHEMVKPDYHRAMVGFLQYDVLEKQISQKQTPSITYERIDGERVRLSIYSLPGNEEDTTDTIWIFEKA